MSGLLTVPCKLTYTAVIISALVKPALAKAASWDVIPSVGPGTPLGPGAVASIRPARIWIIGELGSQERTASVIPKAIKSAVDMKTLENKLN